MQFFQTLLLRNPESIPRLPKHYHFSQGLSRKLLVEAIQRKKWTSPQGMRACDPMDAHLRIVWWLGSTVTTPGVTHTAGSQFSNKNIPKSLNVAKLIIYARQQRWARCLTISHQERMKMCLLPSKQNSTYPCKYCMPRPQICITVTGHKHWMCW